MKRPRYLLVTLIYWLLVPSLITLTAHGLSGFDAINTMDLLRRPDLRQFYWFSLGLAAVIYTAFLTWLAVRRQSEDRKRQDIVRLRAKWPPYISVTALFYFIVYILAGRPREGNVWDRVFIIVSYATLMWWIYIRSKNSLTLNSYIGVAIVALRYIFFSTLYAATALDLILLISIVASPVACSDFNLFPCLMAGNAPGWAGLATVVIGYGFLLWAMIGKHLDFDPSPRPERA